jgi:putative FmdB family regulatory protein
VPLYEYHCQACGRRFELLRRHADPNVEQCPHCNGGPVTRLQSAPAFQFKGSGWYITDYARQGGEKGEGEKGGKDKTGEKSEKTADKAADSAAAASGAKTAGGGGDGATKGQTPASAPSGGGAASKD